MELIDRRKLVSDFWKGVEDCSILSYEDTDDLMENAPTVDAVEVVRCKDCKHCLHLSKKYKCDIACKKLHTDSIYLDFWCRYGERKDNG